VVSGDEIPFLKGNSVKEIYDDTSVTFGDKRPSCSTAKNLIAKFRIGHLSIKDEEHSGRPIQVTILENVDAIHSMILDD
jgi:hypothetical protein